MASLNQHLQIRTPKETFNFRQTEPYNEVFTIRKKVDDTDGFTNMWTGSKASGTYGYEDVKAIVIKNTSRSPVEIQMTAPWYAVGGGTLDVYSADRYMSWVLRANEFMFLPGIRMVGYDSDHSAANAGVVDNTFGYDVDNNLYIDSTANLDDATDDAMTDDTSTTTLYLENGHSKFLRLGDIIRIDNEIMEITSIGDGSDLANSKCTVKRGMFGSTIAVHADASAIRLPFFNMTGKYDKYTYVQTDATGLYRARNLFGYGRNADEECSGIVPGSVAIKFYNPAYQELGLSGIRAGTESGLTASTTYGFNITVDGGSEFTDLSITTDATNTKFGGANGIINKINTVFQTQERTVGSNLFEKKVRVALSDGDIRFTSHNRTRASNVVLGNATGAGGVSNIFGVGRIPAVAAIETTVAPVLPNDEVYTKSGTSLVPNRVAFTYDDGFGNLSGGEAKGSISYETGEIHIMGPANAEFAVSFKHDSGHSGGNHFGTGTGNCISSIAARAINTKIKPTVEIIGFN